MEKNYDNVPTACQVHRSGEISQASHHSEIIYSLIFLPTVILIKFHIGKTNLVTQMNFNSIWKKN